MREYRVRLIADVVTGKLDVRNHPDALDGPLELADLDDAPAFPDDVEVDGIDVVDEEVAL